MAVVGRKLRATGFALALSAGLCGCSHGLPQTSASARAPVSPSASRPVPGEPSGSSRVGIQPLTASQAARLADSLTGTNRRRIASVLAPAVASAYREHPGRFWPTGTRIRIAWRQMHPLSAIIATVPATVTGPRPGRWTFLLQHTSDGWTVLATTADRK
jgi:hypothetical protein